jgi:hypothetical protein
MADQAAEDPGYVKRGVNMVNIVNEFQHQRQRSKMPGRPPTEPIHRSFATTAAASQPQSLKGIRHGAGERRRSPAIQTDWGYIISEMRPMFVMHLRCWRRPSLTIAPTIHKNDGFSPPPDAFSGGGSPRLLDSSGTKGRIHALE